MIYDYDLWFWFMIMIYDYDFRVWFSIMIDDYDSRAALNGVRLFVNGLFVNECSWTVRERSWTECSWTARWTLFVMFVNGVREHVVRERFVNGAACSWTTAAFLFGRYLSTAIFTGWVYRNTPDELRRKTDVILPKTHFRIQRFDFGILGFLWHVHFLHAFSNAASIKKS